MFFSDRYKCGKKEVRVPSTVGIYKSKGGGERRGRRKEEGNSFANNQGISRENMERIINI